MQVMLSDMDNVKNSMQNDILSFQKRIYIKKKTFTARNIYI